MSRSVLLEFEHEDQCARRRWPANGDYVLNGWENIDGASRHIWNDDDDEQTYQDTRPPLTRSGRKPGIKLVLLTVTFVCIPSLFADATSADRPQFAAGS